MDILIAEDDPVAAELLSCALEEAGHNVIAIAADGAEALAHLNDGLCRLLITDWEMPEMDGIGLCKAIRGDDLGRYVYIILLTAREGTSHIVEGLSAGADEFMSKPFEPEELAVRLRTAERILSLETKDVAIFSLAKLAESRDPETGAHLERVRKFSELLARDMAATDKYRDRIHSGFIRLIYETSPLHDIGKVAIPDHVLLKPGRLDDREFEIMKTHSAAGAETLDAALELHPGAEFLRMARDIAGSHHERHDGTGYPNRLAGEDIPLCARIFAIADVYDALCSRRVYKDAFTHDIARSIIVDGSGAQFDPDAVDAFLRCEEQFQRVAETQKSAARQNQPEPARV